MLSLEKLSLQLITMTKSQEQGVTEKPKLFKLFQQVSYVSGRYTRSPETYFSLCFDEFKGSLKPHLDIVRPGYFTKEYPFSETICLDRYPFQLI